MSQSPQAFEDIDLLDKQDGESLFFLDEEGLCTIDSFLEQGHCNEAAIEFVLYRLFDDAPGGFRNHMKGRHIDCDPIEHILGCDMFDIDNRQAKYESQKEIIDHIINYAIGHDNQEVAERFIEEFHLEHNYTYLGSLWEEDEEGVLPLDAFFANYLSGKDDSFIMETNSLLFSQIEASEIIDALKQARKEYLLMLTMNNKSWDYAYELFKQCGFTKDHIIGDLTFLGHLIKRSIGDGGSEDEGALSLIAKIVVAEQNAPEYVYDKISPAEFADQVGASTALNIISGALPFRFLGDYDIDHTAWLDHQFRILEQIAIYKDIKALQAIHFLIKSGLDEKPLCSIVPNACQSEDFWAQVDAFVQNRDAIDFVAWVDQNKPFINSLAGDNEYAGGDSFLS